MFNDQGVSLSVRPLDCTELTCCTITITINIGCCFLIQYLSDYLSIIYLFQIDAFFLSVICDKSVSVVTLDCTALPRCTITMTTKSVAF